MQSDDKPVNEAPAPILVTGAGRNVGAALARALLADGWPVLAHYRSDTAQLPALAAAGAQLVQGDLGDQDAILALAAQIAERAPRLAGIVHNASAFAPTPADAPSAAADFQRYFNVHMLAPYLLTHTLAPRLHGAAGAPANVVMITDIYADNPDPRFDLYCATKAGLQNLALAFAKRLAPAVRVNVIAPGPIRFNDWHDEQAVAQVLATTPMQRSGGDAAVVAAVRAVLANDFLTGAVIPVDGGRRLGRN